MGERTEQIQIRVSPAEKSAIKRRAASAGMDLSTYMRGRALPAHGERFRELARTLAGAGTGRRPYVLAELNDLLTGLTAAELVDAVREAEIASLPPYEGNYLAAMVEQACALEGVGPPPWTRRVAPLEEPRFAADLASLRPHLLRAAPVPFKRRNIFIDASIGDRV